MQLNRTASFKIKKAMKVFNFSSCILRWPVSCLHIFLARTKRRKTIRVSQLRQFENKSKCSLALCRFVFNCFRPRSRVQRSRSSDKKLSRVGAKTFIIATQTQTLIESIARSAISINWLFNEWQIISQSRGDSKKLQTSKQTNLSLSSTFSSERSKSCSISTSFLATWSASSIQFVNCNLFMIFKYFKKQQKSRTGKVNVGKKQKSLVNRSSIRTSN